MQLIERMLNGISQLTQIPKFTSNKRTHEQQTSKEPNMNMEFSDTCAIALVLETMPTSILRIGDTLESKRADIGTPYFHKTETHFLGLSGAIEIYGFRGGGVFKVPLALIFLDGKLAKIANYRES